MLLANLLTLQSHSWRLGSKAFVIYFSGDRQWLPRRWFLNRDHAVSMGMHLLDFAVDPASPERHAA